MTVQAIAADETRPLLYAITHDMRAPVRHIKAFVEILTEHLGEDLDETGAGYFDRLVTASQVIDDKLQAIARYSQVIAIPLELLPCSLDLALEQALSGLQAGVQEREATLTLHPLPDVLGDRDQLVTLFEELIDNALKFCEARPEIEVSCSTDDGGHTIIIADNGPGLKPEHRSAALLLFRRFHPASVPGAGAGLAIVSRIVESHGGMITICSREFDLARSGTGSAGMPDRAARQGLQVEVRFPLIESPSPNGENP